ncbi:PIN domain-containing protein [Shewanella algae]|uniref:PIN domain-containing protein n=1 Tax=Shewanella algae TaxID=38313 RepID=UPI0039854577
MKVADISVSLPLYRIESNVTFHTNRKPTVFERMVLRLCDPGLALSDKQGLSLLGVFQEQLGAGDVSELLESCLSELSTLGALPNRYGQRTLNAPLTSLALTSEGQEFLRTDSLPVRSRTIKVSHQYDPIGDEIKLIKKDGGLKSQSSTSRFSAADEFLRPKNPLPQVERAIAQEKFDWKSPATVIDRIAPVVLWDGWIERRLEISCSDDGVLTAAAPRDAAFQRWLEQAQPEMAWEILLADALTSELNDLQPVIAASVLRDASSARPISAPNRSAAKMQLCIVAQGVEARDVAIPTIVLSSEVSAPTLVANEKQPTLFKLLMPPPTEMVEGFRSFCLPQPGGATALAEIAGNFRLYWAGQPRWCGLSITLNDQATSAVWETLRRHIESVCENSNDPRIAFISLCWRSHDKLKETLWPWFATRAKQPLDALIALVEPAAKAVGLWRPASKDWKAAWNGVLVKAVEESLSYTPNQLEPDEIVLLLNQIAQLLPADNAVPLQVSLLSHAAPICTLESLAKLRMALPSTTEIPKELIANELLNTWLQDALQRKELKLYGPHSIQEPMLSIEEAVKNVYRSIGEQALKAAGNSKLDVSTLTPHALDAVRDWRKAAEQFQALNTPSLLWNALNESVETWNILAQERLAPVEFGHRFIVLDTSALMENPELLQYMHSNEIPVVPRRVLSELDGLKTSEDESRSAKARAAIRQLEASTLRIRHETEYTALLPSEWDAKQPDHGILSTALFFRLNEVVFVSNDINLRNKAQSLGLKTQDSKSYAPLSLASTAELSTHPRKKNKRKNQRK